MFGWISRMLVWVRRNVKRVDAFGVGVEFHALPTEQQELKPTTSVPTPPLPAPPSAGPEQPSGTPSDLLTRDRDAFLKTVEKECGQKKRVRYERILHALINWSLARSGQLVFRPKESKAAKPQATVSFYVRGGPLFWEIYPDLTIKDAKFCCLSSVKASEELKKEAREGLVKVSPRGMADSRGKSAPTISFDDLVSEAALERLLTLLDRLLVHLASE